MPDKELVIARMEEYKERLPPAEKDMPIMFIFGHSYTIDDLVGEIQTGSRIGKSVVDAEMRKLKRY